MRKAGRIVEAMHQRIVDKIEPGMRKCDLVAKSMMQARGVDDFGGDYPAIVPLLPSGLASAPHLTWNDLPMKTERLLLVQVTSPALSLPCRGLYFSASRRRLFLMQKKQHSKVWKRDLLLLVRLATCEDIANGFFAVLKKYGIVNRTGYSIGLYYPPDWGERTMKACAPAITPNCSPGMTFHFMTGLWLV